MADADEREAAEPSGRPPSRLPGRSHPAVRAAHAGAWAILAGMAAFQLARLAIPDRLFVLVVVNAYTWWVYLPAYPIAAGAWAGRRWPLAAAAVVVASLHFAWVLPEYLPGAGLSAEARTAPRLTLMTANLFIENERVGEIAGEVVAVNPDVLVVQEFTPRALAAFEAAGIPELLPFRVGEPGPGPYGTAIYSRYPLTDAETFEADGVPMTRATVTAHDRSIRLYNVHTVSPSNGHQVSHWNGSHRGLLDALEKEDPRILIVAGDLNATRYHRWYREVTSRFALESAHDACGRGNATSWPNGKRKAPGIRIDHVLAAAAFECASIREGKGQGSDHRPIIVEFALTAP